MTAIVSTSLLKVAFRLSGVSKCIVVTPIHFPSIHPAGTLTAALDSSRSLVPRILSIPLGHSRGVHHHFDL